MSEYKLNPVLEFAANEVNVIVANKELSIEEKMDAASMMQVHSIWRVAQDSLINGSKEIKDLRERVKDLENRIMNASMMLADWDGYYNPETKKGSVEGLAELVEDAYKALQGRSWREEKPNT